jgi:AbrB family looped-hinge helix DNA binding protein
MVHTEHYSIFLGERGRLVLPAKLRQHLNLQPGDRLIASVDDEGAIRLISARDLAHQLRGLFADIAPGRSLVDELIAERREEARREEEEAI